MSEFWNDWTIVLLVCATLIIVLLIISRSSQDMIRDYYLHKEEMERIALQKPTNDNTEEQP